MTQDMKERIAIMEHAKQHRAEPGSYRSWFIGPAGCCSLCGQPVLARMVKS